MAAFNKVILIGNMTEDPELKQTSSLIPVTSFRIAVPRRRVKDQDQQTDFINIVAWRGTAEFICKYFQKGKSILITGSIQTRSWVDQNGQKRYATEVVADEAQFVSSLVPSQGDNQIQNDSNTPYSGQTVALLEILADEECPF